MYVLKKISNSHKVPINIHRPKQVESNSSQFSLKYPSSFILPDQFLKGTYLRSEVISEDASKLKENFRKKKECDIKKNLSKLCTYRSSKLTKKLVEM